MTKYKHFIFLFLILFHIQTVNAQVIDSLPINWPSVSSLKMNDNGSVVAYTLNSNGRQQIIVKNLISNKSKTIEDSWEANFWGDSHYLSFFKQRDSIGIMDLKSFEIKYHDNIQRVYTNAATPNIIYKLSGNEHKIVIEDINDGKKNEFVGFNSYLVTDNFNLLLVYSNEISVINCNNLKVQNISFNAPSIKKVVFDQQDANLAILVIDSSHNGANLIYQWNRKSNKINLVFNSTSFFNPNKHFEINDLSFSKDGSKMLVQYTVSGKASCKSLEYPRIWNYEDKHLLSEIEHSSWGMNNVSNYASINLGENQFVRLTDSLHNGYLYNARESIGDYCIIETKGNWSEGWDKESRAKYFIVSLITGKCYKLLEDSLIAGMQLSPDGKFIIYFNRDDHHYYSYNLTSFTKTKLENECNDLFYNDGDEIYGEVLNYGIACWGENDGKVYIYDRYDIWEFDLLNRNKPTNITNYFGAKNNYILRFINSGPSKKISSAASLKDNFILSGFCLTNKNDGFIALTKNKSRKLQILSSDASINFFPITTEELSRGELFCSKKGNMFAFYSMGYNKYPNYYLTKDFKNFVNLTGLSPHTKYTWYKAELHKYKVGDINGEGILYKPSDFDSTKKYPVIFSIYEKSSNYLNRFLYIGPSDGRLNISYFVNKGYIVFVPNIYYHTGSPGKDALNSVTSSFNHISKLKWIDTARCGIQGISWGAYQINYIVTRTNIFKAASVSAGVSDLVSSYNSLRPGLGISAQYHSETGQGRMGGALWEIRDAYIENSPILFADKVFTPMLIEHNKDDEAVPYTQAIEWFVALRRLKKKAWMVEYEKEGHGIQRLEDQIDFTHKLTEFYNCFLKGHAEPQWMSCTIPL